MTKPGGNEADDVERLQYKVTVVKSGGSTIEVTPFALADLQDGDNNHKLCLDVMGEPQSVFFPAGYLTDHKIGIPLSPTEVTMGPLRFEP